MDSFQKQLNKDMRKIRKSTNLLFTDKSSNNYEIPLEEHNKLLQENITKTEKHASAKLEASINFVTKHIAIRLALSNRNERLAKCSSLHNTERP